MYVTNEGGGSSCSFPPHAQGSPTINSQVLRGWGRAFPTENKSESSPVLQGAGSNFVSPCACMELLKGLSLSPHCLFSLSCIPAPHETKAGMTPTEAKLWVTPSHSVRVTGVQWENRARRPGPDSSQHGPCLVEETGYCWLCQRPLGSQRPRVGQSKSLN